jgi:hypothetical protein
VALHGRPVLRGAEVEEVVHHVFLRLGAGHKSQRLAHHVRRAEGDEHLRKLAVHQVARVRVAGGKFLGRELHHVGGRQAVAGDADLDDPNLIELLALGERGERPLAECAEAFVLGGLAAEAREREQRRQAAVRRLLLQRAGAP